MLGKSVHKYNEQLLLKELKAGSDWAWQEIFDQYNAVLFYKAFDLLDDPEEAKDLVQELFIKVWEKRATISIKSSLEAYLYNAIHNRCLDKLDSKKVYNKHIQQYSYLSSELNTPEAPDNHSEILVQRLTTAMQQVSGDPAFNSFKLMHLEQKNYRQIAEQLGINPGSVRNQVSKMFKKLREKLNPDK